MSDRSDQRLNYAPDTNVNPTTLGPWTAYTLSSCALTLTAYSMGAQWLAQPILDIPAGVWAVVAGFGVMAFARRGSLADSAAPSFALPGFGGVSAIVADFFGRLRRAGGEAGERAAPAPSSADRRGSSSERRSGAVVIRIGLDLPADEREMILDAASRLNPHDGVRFEWVTLNATNDVEASSPQRSRRWSDRLRTCDATLRRSTGPRGKGTLEVSTMQHTQGSAWIDWGRPEEFCYAGCFPTRLDPALVSLGNARIDRDCAPTLARLVASAGAFRRTAAFGGSTGVGLNAAPAERAADDMILDVLRWAAGNSDYANSSSAPIRRVAARVGAAWIVGRGLAVSPAERVRLVNAAAAILNREPQVVLQSLASVVAEAATSSDVSNESVDRAMTAAVQRLLELDERATVDPFPFVMSELEHGTGDALTLGRIAAGAAMLWSGARGGSMKFLREDLLGDIEHTGWLRQRPSMRTLLTRLVRNADKARNDWDSSHQERRAA